ncbi:MAG: PEGA domain-containing protein [Candidatus Marinimicrobia bacterium]|jgi:hypothetical protein|nr:PEGA domain-containing protein [Candidatus Neomarinimicrobiota bacterium]MBT3500693.1 PEGA domain-containing protein [Candidatus Neomarinimicrobiota bacterium]MBT3839541.1 PEGA domain-containing protein [Candidatus Neomarinimicrobiota bacterium]MBT3999595.1 PEGA domain-containing protein [Candidatus Neomarinimicrobiota bacterium]MBT4282880.1 PEGA domain-containing protein [Candidatus Neomarinimicrobiota bacterium]
MIQNYKSLVFILLLPVYLNGQVKLSVNTIPKKVKVLLDGILMGESPIKNERISPGVHKFEINKKGYAPLVYDIIVNPSQAVHLDFFLNPIYQIKFKTEEVGLVFELNGTQQWDNKFIRLNIEAGDHLLRVFKLGEIVDEQTIHVDEPKKFNYYLKKSLSED